MIIRYNLNTLEVELIPSFEGEKVDIELLTEFTISASIVAHEGGVSAAAVESWALIRESL